MIVLKKSPELKGQHQCSRGAIQSREAKEYAQLFLSDLCFWEVTHDGNGKSSSVDDDTTETSSQSSSSVFLSLEQKDFFEATGETRTVRCRKLEEARNPPERSSTRRIHASDLRWRAATDPVTGRIYYFHIHTRETRWDMPSELRRWQIQQQYDERRRTLDFFCDMERNILASLARSETIPGFSLADMEQLCPIANCKNQRTTPLSSRNVQKKQSKKKSVRTLSGMDEHLLTNLQSPQSSDRTRTSRDNRNPMVASRTPNNKQRRPPLPSPIARFRHDARPRAKNIPSPAQQPENPKKTTKNSGNHVRRNTGGTMHVGSTLENPDVQATIKCICGVYRAHIVQAKSRRKHNQTIVTINGSLVSLEVFHDDYEFYPHRQPPIPVPSVGEIVDFFSVYYRRSQCEHDTLIMTLIYLERIIKQTNGRLVPTQENWRSLLFSCMILASKVWDDLSMWNIDFSNLTCAIGIAPFSLRRINQLEVCVLTCLAFDVRVSASEYAKYYFLVRTMLIRSGLMVEEQGPDRVKLVAAPLSHEEAKQLEHRTSHYQHARVDRPRRARSFDLGEWFGGSSRLQNSSDGPVLKDRVCLEQLASLDQSS